MRHALRKGTSAQLWYSGSRPSSVSSSAFFSPSVPALPCCAKISTLPLPRRPSIRLARSSTAGLVSSARSPARFNSADSNRSSVTSDLSITFGPDHPALITQTIPEHFASVVAQFPDHPAVVARAPVASPRDDASAISPPRETVYTYSDLDRVSDLLARGLQSSAGVKKGDRVAVSLGNGPEFAALTYAIFKLGAVLVPLNPAFTAAQVAAALKHLGVEVLIIGAVTDLPYKPGRGRSNRQLLEVIAGGGEEVLQKTGPIQSSVVPSLRTILLVDNTADHPAAAGSLDFAQFEEKLPALTPFATLTGGVNILRRDVIAALPKTLLSGIPELDPADIINIQFTSGTTSQPKAAMLSHTTILNNGAFIAHRMGLTPQDRIVCPPPLFHCFGSVLGYMATATTGATLLFPSPAFDPIASLQMAADHRGTGLYGVATMFVAMLEHLEHKGSDQEQHRILSREQAAQLPTHLRTGIAAGSSVPESLMRRLFAALGLNELVICYGMTETGPVSCMTTPHDPFLKRTSTVGRVMPHTAVKIVDPADPTRIVPRNTPGELAASGYLVMKGYWGEPEKSDEVMIRDGNGKVWMHSGDEACMDEDGYVAITGRIKDLIIRGGENIHPLEIENCLFQHPLIAEVSVVGVPDARYGEVVGAFVVPHGGVHVEGGHVVGAVERESASTSSTSSLNVDAIRTWVRDRLSPHLVPKYVFWTDGYPKTASGKIQKFKLKETAKNILEAEAASDTEKRRIAGNTGKHAVTGI